MKSRAWIIEAPKSGFFLGTKPRFTYIMESSLFPGTHARLSNNKSWASRSAARRAAEKSYIVVDGECPLPATSAEQVAEYHRLGNKRRDAFVVWSDDPIYERIRQEQREEDELNAHIAQHNVNAVA